MGINKKICEDVNYIELASGLMVDFGISSVELFWLILSLNN
jgi:hypothetical protein